MRLLEGRQPSDQHVGPRGDSRRVVASQLAACSRLYMQVRSLMSENRNTYAISRTVPWMSYRLPGWGAWPSRSAMRSGF